jgi:hypothetical protein
VFVVLIKMASHVGWHVERDVLSALRKWTCDCRVCGAFRCWRRCGALFFTLTRFHRLMGSHPRTHGLVEKEEFWKWELAVARRGKKEIQEQAEHWDIVGVLGSRGLVASADERMGVSACGQEVVSCGEVGGSARRQEVALRGQAGGHVLGHVGW